MEENNTRKNNGYSIAALVLGIVSVVFSMIWFISIPCAIVAIVFGVKEKKKDKNNKFAKSGFILGIISIVLTILLILLIAISVLISVSLNDGLFEAAREASERTRENEELSRKSAEQIEEIQKSLFDDFDIDYDY